MFMQKCNTFCILGLSNMLNSVIKLKQWLILHNTIIKFVTVIAQKNTSTERQEFSNFCIGLYII